MRTLDQVVAGLPADERAKIATRTRELIAEEMALRHVRQARDFTQKSMAELLGTDQASISKIEKRGDMLLSTLRSYVEAMGGSLKLTAEFPDGSVDLKTIGEVAADKPRRPKKRVFKPELVSAD